MAAFSPDTNLESLGSLKSLISVDTLKAMQLLGFDYKKAIGGPLTEACARARTNSLGSGTKEDTKAAGGQRSGNRKGR